MSRGTAPRLTLIALVTAAAVSVAVPLAGPASAAAEHRIRVTDSAFDPVPADIDQGDTVVWVLQPSAQLTHTVTSEDGLFRAVLVPNSANTEFSYTFNAAGKFTYFCENHLQSNFMAGQVRVAELAPSTTTTTTTEPPPTTTTTAPPPTTTTAPPPPTTTTTRPRSTTTTTRPPATPPSAEAPAQTSTDKPDTTSTTARATTTSGKPTTTTTGKKKPSTTTTQAPETTTSSVPALPADWIPTPDIVPDDASTTTTTSPDTEAAASSKPKSGKGGGGFPLAGAGILGLLLVGGAGWGWYHRSSRYLPA